MPKEHEKSTPSPKVETTPGATSAAQDQTASQTPRPATQSTAGASPSADKGSASQDAISLLKADHRKVQALFKQYESANEQAKAGLVEQICSELIVHTLLEEEIFYPASRGDETGSLLDEAQVEHDSAKILILDLLGQEEDLRDAKVKVLAEQINDHIKEEEAPDGVFAKAQKAGVNTADLGTKLTQRKQELMAKVQSDALPPPRLVSLHPFPNQPAQESRMARQSNDRDRDDQGRFMSNDDDDRGRSYSSRGGNGGQERDERGRFTDDSNGGGRSFGARGGAGDQDRDQRGRFTGDDDDRSYRSRGREDDDYRGRSSGGRSQSGWFGDPQGHSEASRRGWDERGGSSGRSSYRGEDDRGYRSSSRDDDRGRSSGDRGQGGWFGDPEGHAEASRRGWDEREGRSGGSQGRSYFERSGGGGRDYDDDRGGRPGGRGQSGWYGDSGGHAQAARQGWEDRDRNGYRDRDEDNDRGGRSGGGRGHGGWFGDPEGHSEASRGRERR
jgi:hypothetical protein